MRRTERGWDPSFFWQFVKGAHGTANGLERVVLLVTPAISTRSSLPFCWRHSLPPFLLLAGSRTLVGQHYVLRRFSCSSQEKTRKKVMGRQTRGLSSEGGNTSGVFLLSQKVLRNVSVSYTHLTLPTKA